MHRTAKPTPIVLRVVLFINASLFCRFPNLDQNTASGGLRVHPRRAHLSPHVPAQSEPGVLGFTYGLNTSGGPLTRFTWRSTLTSTRSAILIKGIPLFIP